MSASNMNMNNRVSFTEKLFLFSDVWDVLDAVSRYDPLRCFAPRRVPGGSDRPPTPPAPTPRMACNRKIASSIPVST
jgi:hypothetical protein